MEIVKKTSKTDWTDGTIFISKDIITLSPDNYILRRKIMDNNNWIDTLPININDINIRNKLGLEKFHENINDNNSSYVD